LRQSIRSEVDGRSYTGAVPASGPGRPEEDDRVEWEREEQQVRFERLCSAVSGSSLHAFGADAATHLQMIIQQQDHTLTSIQGTLHNLAQQAGLIGQEVQEHNECATSGCAAGCSLADFTSCNCCTQALRRPRARRRQYRGQVGRRHGQNEEVYPRNGR